MSQLKKLIQISLAIIAITLLPLSTDNGFYLKIFFMIGVNYLAASGLNVLVNYTGQKSLGHAGLFAVGAYTVALLTTRLSWNPWLAFLASGVVAAAFGLIIALPALRVRGPALAMVTIAFGIVVEKIVSEWQDVFAGQQGIYGVVPLSIGNMPFNAQQWVWFVGGLGLIAHLTLGSLLKGKYGRAFAAVNASELAAESVGISVYGFKVLAFIISAVTCGFSGALIAQQNQYISSDFITFSLSIFFLLIVLFGGKSTYGPLLGAIVLTLLDAFLARWPEWQHFTYGALLLFGLYIMPNGLSGLVSGIAKKLKLGSNQSGVTNYDAPSQAWRGDTIDQQTKNETLLSAQDLCKAYGGVVPTHHVSLELKTGHIHSLIGPNGAGKTTLLNILSGIVKPDQGNIVFLNTAITKWPAHKISNLGLARTFQNLRLFTDMSVLDNVKTGLHARMKSGLWANLLSLPNSKRQEQEANVKAQQILVLMGLADRALDLAASLPYGMQRRVEIARALATSPQLLLLDEPAAGLNPQETHELIDIIVAIKKLGITVLLIEHHMDIVMAVSDHVIVLDYGQKIAEGRPEEIRNNTRVITAYLGEDDNAADSNDTISHGSADLAGGTHA